MNHLKKALFPLKTSLIAVCRSVLSDLTTKICHKGVSYKEGNFTNAGFKVELMLSFQNLLVQLLTSSAH